MKVRFTINGPGSGHISVEYARETEITVGRATASDIVLESDRSASRRHAALRIRPPRSFIRDLGSMNGIAVNGVAYWGAAGRQVEGELELRHGDILGIGNTTVAIHVITDGSSSSGSDDSTTIFDSPPPLYPEIPGYRILRRLGSGGMGAVYLALDDTDGRTVAVKVANPNKSSRQSFLREIELTRSVVHPNIVRYLGSGMTPDGVVYLVLEYMDGGTVASLLASRPDNTIPLRTAYPVMLDLISGMAYAHSLGLVHRDIKPNNVLLTTGKGGMVAKIADLGLAKAPKGRINFDQNVRGGGTLSYMPPEQLSGFDRAGPSSDVFSLAATFYEALSGYVPYNFSHDRDKYQVVMQGDITPIADRIPFIPGALARVVDKALRVSPTERFRDCREFLRAFHAARPAL